MFTGIVTDLGEVRSVKPRADNLNRITIYHALSARRIDRRRLHRLQWRLHDGG